MEPCTYFIFAFIFILISLGAAAPLASVATFALSAILFAGGLLSKLILRRM